MLANNFLFPVHNDGFGKQLRYYDPYNPKARQMFGRQVMDSLLSLGVDVFWLDGAEPEIKMDTFAAFDTVRQREHYGADFSWSLEAFSSRFTEVLEALQAPPSPH